MLNENVLKSVEDEKFHVWAIDTVDDGIEILTGIKAGQPNAKGVYPKGTVNALVAEKLSEYYKSYVRFAKEIKG